MPSRGGAGATLGPAMWWRTDPTPGAPDDVLVRLGGDLDENATFVDLASRLRGHVVFDLSEVRRINSCGVREWVNFVRDLPGVTELTFTHCSPAIVTQLNMIYNFRGAAKVRSFLAPYVCESCGHEEEKLLDLQTHFPTRDFKRVPDFKCDKCSSPMEFDDLPERYLSFLVES